MDPVLRSLLHHDIHLFSTASERKVVLKKERILVRFEPQDEWVNQELGGFLKDLCSSTPAPSLYSYTPGRGAHQALRRIHNYVRKYKRKTPIQGRALYVLRRDIQEYTDSIPLGEKSPLWISLRKKNIPAPLFASIQNSLRVPLISPEIPFPRCRLLGVPMGSHLTPWIANLYLEEFDHQIQALDPLALYLRYGDDLLWISPSIDSAKKVAMEIPKLLMPLGLHEHPEKSLNLHWSGSGAHGTSSFEYLGHRVNWNNTLGLPGRKRKELLQIARKHFLHLRNLFKASPTGERTHLLLRAIQDFLTYNWRGNSKFSGILHDINCPKEKKSIYTDLLREAARVEFGNTSGYFIRKLFQK